MARRFTGAVFGLSVIGAIVCAGEPAIAGEPTGVAPSLIAAAPASPAPAATGADAKPVVLSAVASIVPPEPSRDCHAKLEPGDRYRRPLRGLRRAVRANHDPRVLVIGSSSTAGTGASKSTNTYVAKLEDDLESAFKGVNFDVFGSGLGGEMAAGQAARMKATVEETRPDLVLWQVGTNDAIGHVDMESFKACLRKTLAWLEDNKFDVMLVDPQYGDRLTKDAYYEKVVAAIGEIAIEKHVLLVNRFEAMRQLSKEHGSMFYLSADQLHMNDTGHRCMAEQLARAIVAGVMQADGETKQAATKAN